MLKNYKKHKNGVIEQIIKRSFNYTPDYVVKSYDAYGEITHRMSYLRLGHIIGSLGYTGGGSPTTIYIGSASPTTNFYNGNISQTQIYNRALSATEVKQNFNATRARFGV